MRRPSPLEHADGVIAAVDFEVKRCQNKIEA
jgi:hypothetical protein